MEDTLKIARWLSGKPICDDCGFEDKSCRIMIPGRRIVCRHCDNEPSTFVEVRRIG